MDPHEAATAKLIARGRQLNDIIDAAKEELSMIESALRSRALAMPHQPLANGSREGRRAMLRDEGQSLTIVFESDLLKASFDHQSAIAKAISSELFPAQMDQLFRLKQTYERTQKDGHKFRLQCADVLGPDLAAKITDILKDRDRNGIVKSKSTVEWNAA
jgi:hypothetical protein